MKNYAIIFHADHRMEGEDGDKAFMKWFEDMGDSVVDGGAPFNPEAQAQVKEGKVTMDSDTTAGYTIIKAENLEAAVTMAMKCPMADVAGCEVRVYETMAM
jgi:hypothetical protein